jgi:hypothetical protein
MQRTICRLVAAAMLIGIAVPATAQQPAPQPQVRPGAQSSITLRGFVSATAFLQDASFGFGNGQNAAWVNVAPEANQWILSGDVRNTRLGLDFRGPPVGGGWNVNGSLEVDFFGGFAGFPGAVGAFTDEQPTPRLRIAYADLTSGGTTLRIGQFWTPLFGYVPASVSHLSFPLGYGAAGKIGWRFPGIFLYQNLTGPQGPTRAQLQLAATRGSWVAVGAAAADTIQNHLSAGERSGFPQLQARVDLSGRAGTGVQWGAYAVAHYDQKDLRPYGSEASPPNQPDKLEGRAFAAGLRLVPGPLTLHGSAYTGRAVGQHLGHITQFGDIRGWGAWGQLGFAFTPNVSAWGYYGVDHPDVDDIRNTIPAATQALPRREARRQNQLITGMIRYATGPYQFGLEWLRAETDWTARLLNVPGFTDDTRTGNQYSFSVIYSF